MDITKGYPILQFFAFDHLPERLQTVSRPFAELAVTVAELPRGPEVEAALRKLMEAKDCAVRAALAKPTRKLFSDIEAKEVAKSLEAQCDTIPRRPSYR